MADYKEIETVIDYLKNTPLIPQYAKGAVVIDVESLPAADVRPVVKAKWEVGGMFDDIGRCSNCHYVFPIDTAMTEFHFCPNCGADMREAPDA